jgi:hypothetical protein
MRNSKRFNAKVRAKLVSHTQRRKEEKKGAKKSEKTVRRDTALHGHPIQRTWKVFAFVSY